jgi:hypothetical protein
MQHFETGLFDDPLAKVVRLEFDLALNNGASVYAAADAILQKHASLIHDPDSGPVILFALADLQMQHGVISSPIRKRVLTWINSGEAIERWRHAPPDIVASRKKVEQELRSKLVAMG